MKRTLLLKLASFLTAYGLLLSHQVSGVTLSGTLFRQTRQPGQVERSYSTLFHFSCSGDRYLMDTAENDYTDFVGFDGRSLYSLTIFSQAAKERSLGKLEAQGGQQPARINSGSFPLNNDPTTRVLWLAFGSGSSLSSLKKSFPALWNYGFNEPVSHANKLENLVLLPGSDGLPSHIDFDFSSKALLENPTNIPYLSVTVSQEEIQKAVDVVRQFDNVRLAEYIVLASTNFQGRTFPTKFQFNFFGTSRTNIRQTYIGEVSAISTETPTNFLPALKVAASVQDYRFSDRLHGIDSLSYQITDGVWLEKDDPLLVQKFNRLKENLPIVSKGSVWTLRILFAMILLVPLLIVVIKKKTSQIQENTHI